MNFALSRQIIIVETGDEFVGDFELSGNLDKHIQTAGPTCGHQALIQDCGPGGPTHFHPEIATPFPVNVCWGRILVRGSQS